MPTASVATPAATSTVTVPSAEGVIVAVYVVPLPERLDEPPPTVISEFTKLDVDSENVMVTAKVEPVAGALWELVIATVGAVPSYVHVYVLDTVLELPAASVKVLAATETVGVPSLLAVQVAVYCVLEDAVSDPREQPLAVMSLAMKLVVASLDVKVRAIAAVLVEAPLDTVLEEIVIVGTVVSYVHVYVLDAVLSLPTPSVYVSAATDIDGVPSLLAVQVAV